jgi:cellulose synthase/poly-beta-1,6-N-acetylglucosamine synthase-like glycosyltransferase
VRESTTWRRAVGRATSAVTGIATAGSAIVAGYLALLSLAGSRPARPAARRSQPVTRFVVMVPAHNEELLIGDTLASLRTIDYDEGLFDVHVVADNCVDRTAEIVAAQGWNAHVRHDLERPGKGPALNWLFERLDRTCDFDAAVIVDADTVVHPGFLRAMDAEFRDGARVAQGWYSVRDPGDSVAAQLRFAALACRHRLRPLGRSRVGASVGLYGNGMAFERSILRRHQWTNHLIEDAELQMELLVRDEILVRFVPDARVEAEMPATFETAHSQHARWERGRVDLARRYLPVLSRRVADRTLDQRIAYADAIADHLVPPLSMLVALQAASLTVNGLGAASGQRGSRRRFLIDVLALGTIVAHVLLGLRSVRAPRSVYRSLLSAPKLVVWKLGVVSTTIRRGGDVTWQRTKRNSET